MVVKCSTTKFIPRPWVLSNGVSLCNWVCTGIHDFLFLSFSVLELQSQVWYHIPLRFFFSLQDEQTPTNCSIWCCNLRCVPELCLLKRISKGFQTGRTTNTVICVVRAHSTNSNSKTQEQGELTKQLLSETQILWINPSPSFQVTRKQQ